MAVSRMVPVSPSSPRLVRLSRQPRAADAAVADWAQHGTDEGTLRLVCGGGRDRDVVAWPHVMLATWSGVAAECSQADVVIMPDFDCKTIRKALEWSRVGQVKVDLRELSKVLSLLDAMGNFRRVHSEAVEAGGDPAQVVRSMVSSAGTSETPIEIDGDGDVVCLSSDSEEGEENGGEGGDSVEPIRHGETIQGHDQGAGNSDEVIGDQVSEGGASGTRRENNDDRDGLSVGSSSSFNAISPVDDDAEDETYEPPPEPPIANSSAEKDPEDRLASSPTLPIERNKARFACAWSGCRRAYRTPSQLRLHLLDSHFAAEVAEQFRAVAGGGNRCSLCRKVVRPPRRRNPSLIASSLGYHYGITHGRLRELIDARPDGATLWASLNNPTKQTKQPKKKKDVDFACKFCRFKTPTRGCLFHHLVASHFRRRMAAQTPGGLSQWCRTCGKGLAANAVGYHYGVFHNGLWRAMESEEDRKYLTRMGYDADLHDRRILYLTKEKSKGYKSFKSTC